MDTDRFLKEVEGGTGPTGETAGDRWSEVIQPDTSNLITGDIGSGKSNLGYYLLERFSHEYDLLPAVVGFPREKQDLLPKNFVVIDEVEDVSHYSDAIIFIDEADLQIPIEDVKARQDVVNFLSLPHHRNQILVLACHFVRPILSRYLPLFATLIFKRPPYLLAFHGKWNLPLTPTPPWVGHPRARWGWSPTLAKQSPRKSKSDPLLYMIQKAEEQFQKLAPEEVVRNSYMAAQRTGWQGLLENKFCSFWSRELSKAWRGEAGQDSRLTVEDAISEIRQRREGAGEVDPYSYSIDELRKMCRENGLSTDGDKHTLIVRLFRLR